MKIVNKVIYLIVLLVLVGCMNNSQQQIKLESKETTEEKFHDNVLLSEEVFIDYNGDSVVDIGLRVIEDNEIVEDRKCILNLELKEIESIIFEGIHSNNQLTDIGIMVNSNLIGNGGGGSVPIEQPIDIVLDVQEKISNGKFDFLNEITLWEINTDNEEIRVLITMQEIDN